MNAATPVPAAPATTTAEDTLKRKSRDAGVVSGGHLVAKALKNEGVDTIFTLCGGHIIDIYDGCIDEGIRIIDVRHEQVAAHAADGYARQTGRLGCVVTTAGPGCTNAVTGIATAFRSESPVLHIGGQGALTQHKMGSLQDLPHVDMMSPITKFAATVPSTERVADMISMAAREAFNGAPGPVYLEIPRDVLDREVDVTKAIVPQPGHYRASTRSLGDPRDIEKLADILVNSERPAILYGQQVWAARGHEEAIALLRGLDIPGYFNGGSRGLLPPGRPAPLRPHPRQCLRRCRRHRHRRHAVRLPHGLRAAHQQQAEAGADRHGLPHRRQEPRHRSWAGRRPGRDPRRGAAGGQRAAQAGQAPGAPAVDEEADGRGSGRHREAHAAVQVEQHADPSVPRRLRAQRVPRRQHHLHRRRRRRRDDLGAGGAPAPAGSVDGSGRARLARRRHRLCDRRRARASATRKCCATTATAPSA